MGEKVFKDLLVVLKRECNCLNDLNQIVVDKSKVIIKNNIEILFQLIEKDRETIAQLRLIERERFIITNKIKKIYGVNSENLSLIELNNILNTELSPLLLRELLKIREKILSNIEELKKKNKKNMILISEAIKFNKISFDLLLNILEPVNQIYDKRTKNCTTNHSVQYVLDRHC